MKNKFPPPAFKITHCPTCGSPTIQWVLERWEFEQSAVRRSTPPVPHWKCGNCGERIFDRVSHRVLDPWRAAQRKKNNSAKGAGRRKLSKSRTKS